MNYKREWHHRDKCKTCVCGTFACAPLLYCRGVHDIPVLGRSFLPCWGRRCVEWDARDEAQRWWAAAEPRGTSRSGWLESLLAAGAPSTAALQVVKRGQSLVLMCPQQRTNVEQTEWKTKAETRFLIGGWKVKCQRKKKSWGRMLRLEKENVMRLHYLFGHQINTLVAACALVVLY